MAELRNGLAPRWDPDRARRNTGRPPLPFGISHGDTDARIERNGRYWIVEGKRDGETLSVGQRKTLDADVRRGDTVVVISGNADRNEIHTMEVLGKTPKLLATWDDYWVTIHEWFLWANAQPAITPTFCAFRPTFGSAKGRVA